MLRSHFFQFPIFYSLFLVWTFFGKTPYLSTLIAVPVLLRIVLEKCFFRAKMADGTVDVETTSRLLLCVCVCVCVCVFVCVCVCSGCYLFFLQIANYLQMMLQRRTYCNQPMFIIGGNHSITG